MDILKKSRKKQPFFIRVAGIDNDTIRIAPTAQDLDGIEGLVTVNGDGNGAATRKSMTTSFTNRLLKTFEN